MQKLQIRTLLKITTFSKINWGLYTNSCCVVLKKMNKLLGIIIIAISSQQLYSQDTSDVKRLKQMSYMKYAGKVDCDSTSGSNFEHRICLNLEFQELDSIMNYNFNELLKRSNNDSISIKLKEYQLTWVNNRRLQSEIISEGYRGHILGIIYLHCMVEATRSRNRELKEILHL